MREYQRRKLNKILLIATVILIVLSIIIGIIVYINLKKQEQTLVYEDKVICNNYFNQIKIDFEKKEVKRDEIKTSLQKEFNITEEQENLILSSQEELQEFFANTVFEIEIGENNAVITNKYQTKKIIIQANVIEDDFGAKDVSHLQDDRYLIEYDTQKYVLYLYVEM